MILQSFIGAFIIFVQILPAIGFLGATVMYGRCQRFEQGHTSYDTKTCHYCATYKNMEYCRTYRCRPVNCSNPDTTTSCCPTCPGTCNYDGSIIEVGETFPCERNTTVCMCGASGLVLKLFRGVITRNRLDEFCNVRPLIQTPL